MSEEVKYHKLHYVRLSVLSGLLEEIPTPDAFISELLASVP